MIIEIPYPLSDQLSPCCPQTPLTPVWRSFSSFIMNPFVLFSLDTLPGKTGLYGSQFPAFWFQFPGVRASLSLSRPICRRVLLCPRISETFFPPFIRTLFPPYFYHPGEMKESWSGQIHFPGRHFLEIFSFRVSRLLQSLNHQLTEFLKRALSLQERSPPSPYCLFRPLHSP